MTAPLNSFSPTRAKPLTSSSRVIPATIANPTEGRHPRLADVDPRTGM